MMDKITHAELVEMFGDEMPLDAVMLITNAPGSMTADDLRANLREIASQPPVSDDLVEAVATALCEADGADWYARSFTTTPNGQTPEEMRNGYRDLARAIIPIVRDDEREACAKVAENFEMPAADDWRNEQTLIATAIRERNGG